MTIDTITAPPTCDGCHEPRPDLTISMPQGRRCTSCGTSFIPAYALGIARVMGDGAGMAYLRTVFHSPPPVPTPRQPLDTISTSAGELA